ncbi:ABC transporter family protein (macronuclear) [Tetrahymena thermophila SB210]|uniref:ABC transporter family protein n=1 Tax=Tetrahymena thermophila (strain SB210) TaxID=312017 RepID=I7MDN9_TETTS|nr:ABC transporter family protein [Tetrahymena thermophila SB210]EAR89965.1 ABC transporter family protein [Tetrahymena thermophila SB210]|eukprot:XP_001010210.1 ABC transporter family protein [Tetrahymena thermophila SB210]
MKLDNKAMQQPDIEKQIKSQRNQEEAKMTESQTYENQYDWRQGYSLVSRILMMNLLSISMNIKRVLKKGLNINLVNLQKLNEDEKCETTSKKFLENLEKYQSERPLKPYIVFKSLISVFKLKCLTVIFFSILDASFEIFNSVALNFCIQSLVDNDKGMAYGWAGIMMGSMFISNLLRCYSWSLGFNMNSQLRAAVINSIYLKISKLSNFAVRSANLGKVINLVSSDMNTTELKFIYLFQMIIGVYTITIALIVLAFRLGPLGMLSIAFLIIILPIQSLIGKVASRYTSKRVQKSDERIKLINEIIEGIRIIKIYGWEEAMKNIINKIRSEEVQLNIKAYFFQFVERAMSSSVVLFSLSLTFIIIYYQGSYTLNLANIFSTIQTLSYLKINVVQFYGQGFSYIFELQIFLKRFIDIFNIKDITQQKLDCSLENVQKIQPNEIARFDKFFSFWKTPSFQIKQKTNNQIPSIYNTQAAIQESESLSLEEIKPTLKNLSFSINKGELLAVVGKVGCGKTTLLQIFLNEIPHFKGYYEVQKLNEQGNPLKISYVEQEPYIFSGTVRENILFGSQYDKQWYDHVAKNCCLLQDFNQMDQGDLTVIGERGVNLSGGQKARICLARAVYSKSDLYLLDDPLSAVDSKVAKELFYSCIKGVLKNKTVILVTHQIHFTRGCDRVVILDESGSLRRIGNFDELHQDLKTLTAGQLKFENVAVSQSINQKEYNQNQKILAAEDSNKNQHQSNESNQKEQNSDDEQDEIQLEEKPKQNQQVKPENVNVTTKTYMKYLSLINKTFFLFPLWLFIFFACAECAFTTFNRSLGYYNDTADDSKKKLFGFWIGFAFLYMLLNGIKYMILSFGIQRGNRSLHKNMLLSLVRAPALFFDRTSSGNLMNKFSNDMSLLDNLLPFCSCDSIEIFSTFLNLMITCIVFNYYTVIPSIIEGMFLVFFMMYAKDIIVKVRQLDLQQKTPVFSHFSSTLQGVITIKVYGQNNAFIQKMNTLCNNSLRANMTFWLSSRFFGGYIQSIAIICATIGVFIIISIPDQDASIQAQSLTYFMLMIDAIQWCLRQMITTDSVMNSYERTSLLINQPSEAPLTTEFDKSLSKQQQKATHWPQKGQIEFKNVIMKYSKELNPVLKGLNFNVSHGQKIGCVGRTGAGKSSILQALFRLTESETGSQITVDGVDISKLGLHKLRQNISIIPQIPFVFGGTIRRNLDPLNEYTDEQIWEALRCVELDKYILQKCKDGINTDMTVASSVFSVGQKQLVCLARALLKQNKMLVLDEATANVDMETDNFIQKTIRDKFEDCTVLTIAHRLNTIADYDKVIVLSDGVVAEYDTPFNLLANSDSDQEITKNTIFAQMVKNTGKNNSENIFQMAKTKYLKKQLNKN